jgi:hypothetical protein
MKTVMNSSMVAHVWAQQSQQSGRNGTHSLFFEGPTIYSYRESWPMASFVTSKRGRAVLMRTDTYSVTTSNHMTDARCAARGTQLFNVASGYDGTAPDHAANKAFYQQCIADAVARIKRARSRIDWDLEQLQTLVDEANAYSQFFAQRWRLAVPKIDAAFIADVRARSAEREAKREEKFRLQMERDRLEVAERIPLWRRGETVSLRGCPDTLLRVRGERVETSRGADVPVDHAKRLWPVIQRVMRSGTPYVRNGHTEHVGHFTVDRIEPNGDMEVGCHFIKHDEIARIASELGLA